MKSNPAAASTAAGARYLVIKLGSFAFAIPAASVLRIEPNPQILALPHAMATFQGITVIHLAHILGLVPSAAAGSFVTLVVDLSLTRSPPTPAALLVDKILNTVTIPPTQIRPPDRISRAFRKHLTGSWHGRSRPVYVLDLSTINSPTPY